MTRKKEVSQEIMFDEESTQENEFNISFEEAVEKLEKIVQELENGELSLEDSLEKFALGVSLSKVCYSQINKAQNTIDKILQENDDGVMEELELKLLDKE